jgi:predicted secreted protein
MKPDDAHPHFSPDGRYLLFESGHFTDGKRLNLMMVDLKQVFEESSHLWGIQRSMAKHLKRKKIGIPQKRD